MALPHRPPTPPQNEQTEPREFRELAEGAQFVWHGWKWGQGLCCESACPYLTHAVRWVWSALPIGLSCFSVLDIIFEGFELSMSGWLQSSRIFLRNSGKWSLACRKEAQRQPLRCFPSQNNTYLGQWNHFWETCYLLRSYRYNHLIHILHPVKEWFPIVLFFFSSSLKSCFFYF